MTPAEATRPVLIAITVAAAAALTGCGLGEGERIRFQGMAEQVAAIDVPLERQAPARRRDAADSGLRLARFSPVKVAVMDPHDMWDARDAQDAGLRGAVAWAARPVQEAAEPLVVRGGPRDTPEATARPPLGVAAPHGETRTIQLGAYSTEAGARQAWTRLKAQADLSTLSPVFESVEIDGRVLTRLKVGPIPTEAAAAFCQAAQVADAWCARQG